MLATLKELWRFLKIRKKIWLAPLILLMVILASMIVFAQGSALAPFIYALF